MAVRISRSLHDRLLERAAAVPDAEICGILLGSEGEIVDAVEAGNISAGRDNSFEIDPRILFEHMRRERCGGPRMIGHYHSHPGGSARPSIRDAEAARGDGGRLWLILGGGEARAWRFSDADTADHGFDAVALIVG